MAAKGFAIIPMVLAATEVDALLLAVETVSLPEANAARGGVRNLIERVPKVRELAASSAIRSLVESILGKEAFAVRGIFFDKTPEANWKVPWHQDLTIAVAEKRPVPGFGPWTVKDGVQHVQPATEVLEGMLAVRIHLDECGPDNGPVRVLPGSHLNGRLGAEQIQTWQEKAPAFSCVVGRGGVLLMRPLLLHASSAANSANHRRVIHLEFATSGLPDGLRWHNET
jgi:ectoine hydroxylase-related dioxygenase (phytanoyl-CoA dioxygenase family)